MVGNSQFVIRNLQFATHLKSGYNPSVTHLTALPLFPLRTVLFPGQLLPLHIFEPRYRLLIEECLAGQLAFGVVLIREGHEVGETATPFDVGTTARIGQVERLPDGRMNILCVGEARFKLTALHHRRPFLTGDADLWPWVPLTAGDGDRRIVRLTKLLTRYMQQLAQATGNTVSLDAMHDEPGPLASLAAIALQIPTHEKQSLLSAPTIGALLDNCLDLLARENRAFQITACHPTVPNEPSLPISLS